MLLSVSGSAATMKLWMLTLSYTFTQPINSLGVKHGLNDRTAGNGAKGGTKAQILGTESLLVQSCHHLCSRCCSSHPLLKRVCF